LSSGSSFHKDRLVRQLPVLCDTPLVGSSLSERAAVSLERLLRSIADRHRLQILNMLVRADGAAICVCELTAALDVPQQNVSYHLKQLVAAGVIEREPRGRYAYYALAPGALDHIAALVAGRPASEAMA
jgi:ArsR family transcriptional regulator